MQNPEKQIDDLLRDAGATLIRKSNHPVYRFPNGRNFVTAGTPSDRRGSRNSLADLRRLLAAHGAAKEEVSGPNLLNETSAPHKPRVKIPNRVPHEKSSMPALSLASNGEAVPCAPRQSRSVTFNSVADLLSVVDEIDSFWALDTCGRMRILMKVISQFAKVEAVPYRYCDTTPGEYADFLEREVSEDIWDRMEGKWLDLRSLCLLVSDPVEGDILIEAEAMRARDEHADILVMDAHFYEGLCLGFEPVLDDDLGGGDRDEDMNTLFDLQDTLTGIRDQPRFAPLHATIDQLLEQAEERINCIDGGEPSRYIMYEFTLPAIAKERGEHYQTTESWTNPSITRATLREILQFQQAKAETGDTRLSSGLKLIS